MKFTTIHDLVGNTKGKINKLNEILDVLLSNYRTASEVIDSEFDHRRSYLEQLLELNELIGDIVDKHPAVRVDSIWQDVVTNIKNLANAKDTNTNI